MAHFKGWRYAAFIGGFVGMIGLTLYPIAFSPMMDASQYKFSVLLFAVLVRSEHQTPQKSPKKRPKPHESIQKEARKNINIEEIQPGNMKVWSDPFDRKKPQSE